MAIPGYLDAKVLDKLVPTLGRRTSLDCVLSLASAGVGVVGGEPTSQQVATCGSLNRMRVLGHRRHEGAPPVRES